MMAYRHAARRLRHLNALSAGRVLSAPSSPPTPTFGRGIHASGAASGKWEEFKEGKWPKVLSLEAAINHDITGWAGWVGWVGGVVRETRAATATTAATAAATASAAAAEEEGAAGETPSPPLPLYAPQRRTTRNGGRWCRRQTWCRYRHYHYTRPTTHQRQRQHLHQHRHQHRHQHHLPPHPTTVPRIRTTAPPPRSRLSRSRRVAFTASQCGLSP